MIVIRRINERGIGGSAAEPVRGLPLDAPEPQCVETPSHKKIYEACTYAQTGALVLVYGAAGVGKSTAVARYAAEHLKIGRTAYHINLLGVKTPASMLQTIAESVHSPGSFGAYRNVALLRVLADYLSSGDLLILDEAQSLRPDALDMVRFFLDERGIGLVLCGNELVFSAIAGKNRRAQFAQLHSRVGMRLFLPHSTQADADAILSAWSVDGRAGRDYGRQVALGVGGLRRLCLILRRARIGAAAKHRPIDHELMHSAASTLGLTD